MKKINDETILAALISTGSIRKAAKVAACSEATIRARLKNNTFAERFAASKTEILSEACAALSSRLTLAADTLCEIMENKENPSTVRVTAADALLRHGIRYVETTNILARLDALEKAQNESDNNLIWQKPL